MNTSISSKLKFYVGTLAACLSAALLANPLSAQSIEHASYESIVESSTQSTSRTFSLAHQPASDIIQSLEQLFGADSNGLINIPNTTNLSTVKSCNSIVASGPEGEIQVIEKLIGQLDQPDLAEDEKTTRICRLDNALALDVEHALNEWVKAKRESGTEALTPVIISETVSNSLIITCEEGTHRELLKVIEALDTRPDIVKLKLLLTKKDANGETVVSKPQIITMDNLEASVTFGTVTETYTIKMVPHIIRGDQETVPVIRGLPVTPKRRY